MLRADGVSCSVFLRTAAGRRPRRSSGDRHSRRPMAVSSAFPLPDAQPQTARPFFHNHVPYSFQHFGLVRSPPLYHCPTNSNVFSKESIRAARLSSGYARSALKNFVIRSSIGTKRWLP